MAEKKPIDKNDYIIAGLFILIFILSFVLPLNDNGPSICLFRNTTGLPCPGCGMTRAFIAISEGNLELAAFYHPLGLIFYAGMLFFLVIKIIEIIRGYRGIINWKSWVVTIIFLFIGIALLAQWIIRLFIL